MIGLVTGANRGLGISLVKEGLKRGHTLFAGYRRNKQEGLMQLKEQYPDRLFLLDLDVTKEGQAESCAEKVKRLWGHLDFLVNNAGVLYETKTMQGDCIADLDVEKFRSTLEVNITGMAIILKYFIALLYESKDACILNITSEAGHLSPRGYEYLAYSVSKYGANMYTQKIRNYLAEKRSDKAIRVYMVHPGRMDTDMGKENAQIQPKETAQGLFDILERKKAVPEMEIPFINYKGEPMPY